MILQSILKVVRDWLNGVEPENSATGLEMTALKERLLGRSKGLSIDALLEAMIREAIAVRRKYGMSALPGNFLIEISHHDMRALEEDGLAQKLPDELRRRLGAYLAEKGLEASPAVSVRFRVRFDFKVGEFLVKASYKAVSFDDIENETRAADVPTPPPVSTSLSEAHFTVLAGEQAGECFKLQDDSLLIGRANSTDLPDIVLLDSQQLVGRKHATVRRERHGHLLCDENSRNGTSLNGTRLSPGEWAALKDGDEITLASGRVVLRYSCFEGEYTRGG